MVVLYHLITFLGAFLLFKIEFIVALKLLPLYGGSFMVWTTCMMFFQIFLFFGYFYAHLLSSRNLKKSAYFHLGLLALSFLCFPFQFEMPQIQQDTPIFSIGVLLLTTIGLPFLLLSTTTILMQVWLASSALPQRQKPYILYSTSNLGSFAAIFSYPFLIQPSLPLKTQLLIWYICYGVYVLLHLFCLPKKESLVAEEAINSSEGSLENSSTVSIEEKIPPTHPLLWFFISAGTCALLLAVTNVITMDISPAPVLWVVPLAAYLFSFILVFSDRKFVSFLNSILFVVTLLDLAWLSYAKPHPFYWLIFFLLMLFTCCCIFHQMLFQSKPASPKLLPPYYILIAMGGCFGSILINLFMPILMAEAPTILVDVYVAGLILVASLLLYYKNFLRKICINPLVTVLNIGLILAVVFVFVPMTFFKTVPNIQVTYRNFYGILKVSHFEDKKFFWHGSTIHGAQSLKPEEEHLPIFYYRKGTPFEDIFQAKPNAQKIAVLGLGIGSLLAYSKPGQQWDLYEIDSDVIEIAKNHFSYIQKSPAQLHFMVGDGRLKLQESKEKYDIIFMDVFSGDAIPTHMATYEAFSIYLEKLSPEGVIIFHCSNRFLNLFPVVTKLANAHHLESSFVIFPNSPELEKPGVLIFIATRSKALNEKFQQEIAQEKKYRWNATNHFRDVSLWTDERVNFLEVFMFFEKNRLSLPPPQKN